MLRYFNDFIFSKVNTISLCYLNYYNSNYRQTRKLQDIVNDAVIMATRSMIHTHNVAVERRLSDTLLYRVSIQLKYFSVLQGDYSSKSYPNRGVFQCGISLQDMHFLELLQFSKVLLNTSSKTVIFYWDVVYIILYGIKLNNFPFILRKLG